MIRVLYSRVILIGGLVLLGLIYYNTIQDTERYRSMVQSLPESLQNFQPNLVISHSTNYPLNGDKIQKPHPTSERVKAAYIILARNKDLKELLPTIQQLEATFNKEYNYPYVFLNEVPFEDSFKTRILELTKAKVEFGLIPEEHWSIPTFLNKEEVLKNIKGQLGKYPYGENLSYHHMIRYESGLFSQHELMQKYDYYWRVEPGVSFHCKLDQDPFLYMKTNKKKYGFVIMMPEFMDTIPTLWKTVKEWISATNPALPSNATKTWFMDQSTGNYNGCHFWSNFEIGALDMYRTEQFRSFFDFLDKKGGFYLERWGDAPVHSIYAALALSKEQFHFFDEIGYTHPPYTHCPVSKLLYNKCNCEPLESTDLNSKCLQDFFDEVGYKLSF